MMQIKGPNVPKDALAGGGDTPDTSGLDTLGKVANKAGEKVSHLNSLHKQSSQFSTLECACHALPIDCNSQVYTLAAEWKCS